MHCLPGVLREEDYVSSRFMIGQLPNMAENIFFIWKESNPDGTALDAFKAAIAYVGATEFGYEYPKWLEDR